MHAADAADLAAISQAERFIASIFIGTGRFDKIESPAINPNDAAAFSAALDHIRHEALTLDARHRATGRKAMIYACLPGGRNVLVPESFNPDQPQQPATAQPTENTVMPTKTFGKRFNAQRAARVAIKNPKAQEGVDFTTAKNDKGEWTFSIALNNLGATDAGKANANSWDHLIGRSKRRARKNAEAKAAKAKADKPKNGKPLGIRAQAEADAAAGKLPSPPDFSAETHARFRGKLDEVVKLVKAGDVKALKAFKINPISTSPKAIDRYRNLAVVALEAKAAG